MALTRAQLLSGNQGDGIVLPNQPQGVIAGAGITISNTGIISVNASTTTGLVKLNNPLGYNSYVWPGADGTSGEFLQTDGAGNLEWATPQGFAVVTVQPSPAPVPAEVGELWFDCSNGTLNVYQDCVGTGASWFNVAQPGFPVLPANTSSNVAWTGSGTQASPYQMTVTTTGSGSAVQIINTVTINGLAPFQYVPIIDLNAVANGGRFSFTNYYADGSGVLVFNTVFTDLPPSGSGISYTAAIKVGYGTVYIRAIVNVVSALVVTGGSISGPLYVGQQLTYTPGVPSGGSTPYGSPTIKWFANGNLINLATSPTFTLTGAQLGAQITASTTYTDASSQTATGTSAAVGPVLAAPAALTITSPGTLTAPNPSNVVVGDVLSYTAGSFSGGIPPVTPSWIWQRAGVDIAGTAGFTSYTTVTADSGQAITVRYRVQDSSTPTPVTQTASTPAITPYTPIPGWTPGNAMNSSVPGTSSATWNNPTGPVTSTGCVVLSLTGAPGSWSQSVTATNGQPLYVQWNDASAGTCAQASSGTTIQGTVTGANGRNSYSVVVNRKPAAFGFAAGTTTAPLSSLQTSTPVSITGINAPSYITLGSLSAGATGLEARVNNGTWTPVPSAPSTSLVINNTNTLEVRFTTGSTASGIYTAVVNIGDGDSTQFTASSPGFVVQNTASAAFPGLTFDNGGSPNAAPDTLNGYADPGTLGNLYGFVSSNAWPTGLGTTLSSPGTTPTMKMRVGAAAYATSGVSVASGQTLNLAWNQAYLDTVASNTAASGSIQGTVGGTTYTNAFSFTVKRAADFTVPTGASGPGGTITISQQTPDDYNVPVKVYQTAGTLTNVLVSINGASAVALPTSVGTALTISPGDTVAYTATAPAGVATYSTQLHIGDTVKTWSYQVTVTPTVSQPDILNPNDGATGLNPAVNSPAGITVDTDVANQPGGFITNYGGTQVQSDWYVYKAIPYQPTTSAITNVSTAPIYSNNLTSPGGFSTPTFGPTKAFDGLLTTTAGSSTVGATATWNTSSTPQTGLIEMYYAANGGIFETSMNVSVDGGTAVTVPINTWTTISSTGSSSSITVQSTGGTTSFGISAFRVNGQILIDGATQLTLTNSTDLANMQVGDTVTQDSAYAPTTSAIASVGTVNYDSDVTSTGFTPSGPVSNMFDGTTTNAYNGVTTANGGTATLTFTPASPLTGVTSLRIFVYAVGNNPAAGQAYASVNGGTFNALAALGGGTGTWFDISGSLGGTTLTSVSYQIIAAPGGQVGAAWYAIEVNGSILTNGSQVQLTFTNSTDLVNFQPGMAVTEVGGGGDASGTVGSVNVAGPTIAFSSSSGTWTTGAQVRGPSSTGTGTITAISTTSPFSLTLNPSTGAWGVGKTAIDTSRTITPPAPSALPPTVPDPTKYQAVTGFNPKTVTSGTFNSTLIPQADLTTNSKYYASVIYTGSGSPTVTSQAATWSSFTTASTFVPAPGGAYNGGYFGGQINDGGIIYNLIVSPAASGYNSSKQFKNADTADATSFQNQVYGFPASQAGAAAGPGTYPAFDFARGLSISGYNDWYLPAKNEMEVLYYFLKPDAASGGTANNTSAGSNPNAVSPEPVSTNYTASNPAQTSSSLFVSGTGTQAFATAGAPYWSASVSAANTGVWYQLFTTGNQVASSGANSRTSTGQVRAIRREYANAPVAIGAAYGGGYFAGQYQDGGVTYNLIVAPVASGYNSSVQYKTSDSADTNPNSQNTVYGKLATDQFNDAAHPAFQWAKGLTISGFSDWYIPAKNELAILCYNLGPNWTTASAFKAGTGTEAFATTQYYWSSSEDSGFTSGAWAQYFNDGSLTLGGAAKSTLVHARAVRRVAA